jgi:hypothetical protein
MCVEQNRITKHVWNEATGENNLFLKYRKEQQDLEAQQQDD